jgi:hypothetical protein
MNLLDEIRITQVQLVVTAVDVNALGVEHRTHSAVKDVNAIRLKNVSEGFHFPNADLRMLIAESKPLLSNPHSAFLNQK